MGIVFSFLKRAGLNILSSGIKKTASFLNNQQTNQAEEERQGTYTSPSVFIPIFMEESFITWAPWVAVGAIVLLVLVSIFIMITQNTPFSVGSFQ